MTKSKRQPTLKGDRIVLEIPLTINDRYEIENVSLHTIKATHGLISAEYEKGVVILTGHYFRAERASAEILSNLDDLHRQHWNRVRHN